MTITIIDDARIIRDGLKKIIQTNCPQYEIVGEAGDGEKGLELLLQMEPDVCIVDMKMPKMDGIEMVARSRKVSTNTKFIVLSGYADFEYAKCMISYGCYGYLLKPVDHNELIGLLNSLEEGSTFASQENQELQKIRVERERNSGALNRMLGGSLESVDCEALPETLLVVLDKNYITSVLRIDNNSVPSQKELGFDTQMLIANIDLALENEKVVQNHFCEVVNEKSVMMVLPLSDTLETERLLRIISLSIRKNFGYTISIGISSPNIHRESFIKSFREASEALRSCFYQEWGTLKRYSLSISADELPVYFLIEKQIFRNLAMENHKGAVEKIQNLLQELRHYEVPKELCLLILNRTYVTLRKVLHRQDNQQLLLRLPKSLALEGQLLKCERMFEVGIIFEGISSELLDYARQSSSYDSSKKATLRKVLRYMDQNYHSRLSLAEVAKVAHMAPSYFSMYFKKETGETFVSFVTRIKIEKSKELLQDPSIKIYELSAMVGFDDSKYFSRKFRAITGMTPKEYRNSICTLIDNTGITHNF